MGFKTKNYKIEELNITIDNAYARISTLTIVDHKAYATFNIQQDRESTESLPSLELVTFSCVINKNLPVHEQVYNKAKESLFTNWEDDIIVEEIVEEETEDNTEEE